MTFGTRALGRLAIAAAFCAAALSAGGALASDSAVIFSYHRFGELAQPSTNIRLDQFDAHLRELKTGGYTVLPVAEIVKAIRDNTPLPEKTIGITIDDAYRSVYTEAWPRLRKAGFPFTLFVSTDDLDRGGRGYLTWAQMREMAAAGVTLGNHTASHLHMPELDAARNASDVERSLQRFEQELGIKPELFAYPFGEASNEARQLIIGRGFIAGFGQHSGVAHGSVDRYYLPRFALNETYGDIARFRQAANALPLPVRDLVPADPMLKANPPTFAFTLADDVANTERLACFVSNSGPVDLRRSGQRIEIRLAERLPPGRGRLNCTLPGDDGRWRWLGYQVYVPRER